MQGRSLSIKKDSLGNNSKHCSVIMNTVKITKKTCFMRFHPDLIRLSLFNLSYDHLRNVTFNYLLNFFDPFSSIWRNFSKQLYNKILCVRINNTNVFFKAIFNEHLHPPMSKLYCKPFVILKKLL